MVVGTTVVGTTVVGTTVVGTATASLFKQHNAIVSGSDKNVATRFNAGSFCLVAEVFCIMELSVMMTDVLVST